MHVNFYCYLSAQVEGKRNARKYLEEFLSDITGSLQAVCHIFCVAWAYSSLAPEPNYLLPSYPDGETMLLPFSFHYSRLEQAYLRIDLLQSLFRNLAYQRGIDVVFEYHLDD